MIKMCYCKSGVCILTSVEPTGGQEQNHSGQNVDWLAEISPFIDQAKRSLLNSG